MVRPRLDCRDLALVLVELILVSHSLNVCWVGIDDFFDGFSDVGSGELALAHSVPAKIVSLSSGFESNLTDGIRGKTAPRTAIAAFRS